MLDDHDVTAEQALAALGGDRPRCLQVYDAWRAVCTTERPMDVWAQATQFGFHGATPIGGRYDQVWAALPGALQDVAAVVTLVRAERASARGGPDVRVPQQLHRQLSDRVGQGLKASLGPLKHQGIRVDASFAVHALEVGAAPWIEVDVGRNNRLRIDVGVSLGWVVDVWGRRAASIGNRFVLRLHPPGALALRWDVRGREIAPVITGITAARDLDGSWTAIDGEPEAGGAFWSVRHA